MSRSANDGVAPRGIVIEELPKEMVEETVIPGDGYCAINSIIHGMKSHGMRMVPSCNGLLQMIEYELMRNLNRYESFIGDIDFVGQLESLIHKRSYRSDINDLVMHSASNALGLVINIYERHEDKYVLYNMKSIHPYGTPVGSINVVRYYEHYNSITIKGLIFKTKSHCHYFF